MRIKMPDFGTKEARIDWLKANKKNLSSKKSQCR